MASTSCTRRCARSESSPGDSALAWISGYLEGKAKPLRLVDDRRRVDAMRYDASKQPDPQAWLALDESEGIDLAIAYHRRNHLRSAECFIAIADIGEGRVNCAQNRERPQPLHPKADVSSAAYSAAVSVRSSLLPFSGYWIKVKCPAWRKRDKNATNFSKSPRNISARFECGALAD
jgi:hypothetical protein